MASLPITILMHAHNAAMHLEHSLQPVLMQDYPCFEVLVVVDSCTDLTIERLEQQELVWSNLRHMVIPTSAWHPDRHRMAMSLGAKAAMHDTIMLLSPEYVPQSTLWLQQMASRMNEGTDRVLGYTGWDKDKGKAGRMGFVSTYEQWLSLSLKRPGVEESNTLIKREALLSGRNCTTLSLANANTVLRRRVPYGYVWRTVYARALRHHLSTAQLGIGFRILHFLAIWQAWSILVASALAGLLSGIWWIGIPLYIVWNAGMSIAFRRFCKKVDESPYYISLWWYGLQLPLLIRR